MNIDSNGNRVEVGPELAIGERKIQVVRLVDDPTTGYVVEVVGEGGFGDESCPSSYNRPCHGWFGPNQTYPNAEEAISAISVD